MTETAGTALAVLAGPLLCALALAAGAGAASAGITPPGRHPGTTGARNAAKRARAAAGPQVPAPACGRNAGHTWAAR